MRMTLYFAGLLAALAALPVPAEAASYPAPQQADWFARDFHFHTGELMPVLRLASVMFGIATSGGTLGWQSQAATHAEADHLVDAMLGAPPPRDANDFIYQWDASRDYDAAPGLSRISAPLLAINAADDERNPPETGVMAQAMQQVPGGRLNLIPASAETRGHATTAMATFYAEALRQFIAAAPHRDHR